MIAVLIKTARASRRFRADSRPRHMDI